MLATMRTPDGTILTKLGKKSPSVYVRKNQDNSFLRDLHGPSLQSSINQSCVTDGKKPPFSKTLQIDFAIWRRWVWAWEEKDCLFWQDKKLSSDCQALYLAPSLSLRWSNGRFSTMWQKLQDKRTERKMSRGKYRYISWRKSICSVYTTSAMIHKATWELWASGQNPDKNLLKSV